MTTETTLATLPKEKSVEQNSIQTTVEDIKQVTQQNTVQDKSLEAKQLKEKVLVDKQVEAKTVTKPAKANHPKAEVQTPAKAKNKPEVKVETQISAQSKKLEQSAEEKAPKTQHKEAVHIYDTIVVGAGISGIAAAYKMNQAGYNDYVVLEKASRVGGTWRDNNYPGCGCDVPSALYSFSFSPSHKWSHLFAKQPEILSYLEEVVEKYDLGEKIEFNNELISAKWDEAQHIWHLETSKGQYQAKTVIFTTGPITEPALPKLKGIESFKGEMFHSARWNHDYDLTGKRVAVIGTGASAIQFIP